MTFGTVFNDTLDSRITGSLGDSLIVSPGDTFPNRNVDSVTLDGKLDKRYLEVNGVESWYKTAVFPTSLIDGTVHGSMVEDGVDQYKVIGVQPDQTGMTMLILESH